MKKILGTIGCIAAGALLGFWYGKTHSSSVQYIPVAQSGDGKGFDYLSINDDKPILDSKSDYYALSDAKTAEEVPPVLQQYLINEYYSKKENHPESCTHTKQCSLTNSEFSIAAIDLNDDGTKEYVVMPFKACDCYMRGASGNGDIVIVGPSGDTFAVIGRMLGNGYVLSKKKTNQYHDILVNFHSSAGTGNETLYKYQTISNGIPSGKYEEAFSKWYDFSRK